MKKTFFAVALLVSTIAAANVKLTITARCGDDTKEQSCELAEHNSFVVTHDGIRSVIALEKEETDGASFVVTMKKDAEDRELAQVPVKVVYGATETIKCPASHVNAELVLNADLVKNN